MQITDMFKYILPKNKTNNVKAGFPLLFRHSLLLDFDCLTGQPKFWNKQTFLSNFESLFGKQTNKQNPFQNKLSIRDMNGAEAEASTICVTLDLSLYLSET